MYNNHAVAVQEVPLTEEQKQKAAKQRARIVPMLQVFAIIHALAGLGLLGASIAAVIFYHDNSFATPYFVGGFIASPGDLLVALGSYIMYGVAKDFSVEKMREKGGCGILAYIGGFILALAGGIVGISLAASSSAVTKEKCSAHRDETCTDDPNPETNQILAFVIIGLCAISIVLSIGCVVLLNLAPLAFKTTMTVPYGHMPRGPQAPVVMR